MITCCRKAYRAGYILGIFGILGIPEALPRIGNRVESVYRARPAEASAPAFGRESRVFPPVPVGGRLQPRGDAMGRCPARDAAVDAKRAEQPFADRKSVVEGMSVLVRGGLVGCRCTIKKNINTYHSERDII